jgi:hypothetical protein
MMTTAQIIEWCIILNIHVFSTFLSVSERIGQTMNGPTPLDDALTTERCDTSGFVVFRGAFGAVLYEKRRTQE